MRTKFDANRLSKKIRKNILKISYQGKVGHIGSAFSIVEILLVLYFKILNLNKKNLQSNNRDRFILSKGHAVAALLTILAEKRIISPAELNTYCQNGGKLEEHPNFHTKGVEVCTGSLGHGLPIGIGMAFKAKLFGDKYKVVVLISDAECDEGETWEAALFASHHRINNLFVYLDYNHAQALGKTDEVLSLEPLMSKWQAFGWNTVTVDGHNQEEIFKKWKKNQKVNKPTIFICQTIRGKGVSFMENNLAWHYKNPSESEYLQALEEINKL